MMIFITGGVRSGKSGLAEKLAMRFACKEGRLIYVACGQRTDEEMDARIRHHRERRKTFGYKWNTVEKNVDLAEIKVKPSDTLLIDCVTTLLASEFFREDKPGDQADERIVRDLLTLAQQVQAVIIVSNELSFEPIHHESTMAYANKLGVIHQRLVHACRTAILVEHGIPVIKKGGI